MSSEFRLLMIGAMYENGGNTTHRFLDGHPELHVYPFESQIGTRHVNDMMSSLFPLKYRWPVFALDASPVPVISEPATGQMLIPLPAGTHRVVVRLDRTWDRTAGGIISLVVLFALLILALATRFRTTASNELRPGLKRA